MTTAADEKPADTPNPTKEAAKWLVVTFGALGAALIGSASIQDLAKLSEDGRDDAYQGLALGLLGVVLVVVPAAFVLAGSGISLSKLARSDGPIAKFRQDRIAKHHEFLLGGWGSVTTLVEQHALYQYERLKATAELKQLGEPPVPAGLEASQRDAFEKGADGQLRDATARQQDADAGLERTNPHIRNTAQFLAERWLQTRFLVAVALLVVGVMMAAVGTARFATAETQEQAEASEADAAPAADLDARPVPAQLVIEDEAVDRFQPLLGEQCQLDALAVVVLGSTKTTNTVLVLPQAGCTPRQLEVTKRQGELTEAQPVCELLEESTGHWCS